MTVCIAAICDNNAIVGASDRMISIGDIQFEPASPKIRYLTVSIVAFTAGDAGYNDEVLAGVREDVSAAILNDPYSWVSVSNVAYSYVRHWNAAKHRRASAAVLGPHGMTADDFRDRQAAMERTNVERLSLAISNFVVPWTECMIAGIDATGPHIWAIFGGTPICYDSVGFGTIGVGRRHAESQMMFGGHGPSKPLNGGLLLVHTAKKRAEVAPGVGAATDLILIGPGPGHTIVIRDDLRAQMEADYVKLTLGEKRALEKARAGLGNFLSNLPPAPVSEQESTTPALTGEET